MRGGSRGNEHRRGNEHHRIEGWPKFEKFERELRGTADGGVAGIGRYYLPRSQPNRHPAPSSFIIMCPTQDVQRGVSCAATSRRVLQQRGTEPS
eukprot:scaffold97758_cov66-Phaeocystis_antarctica.AAC.4